MFAHAVVVQEPVGSLSRSPVLTRERNILSHAVPQLFRQDRKAAAQSGVLELAPPDFQIEPRLIVRLSLAGHLAYAWGITSARLPGFAAKMRVIASTIASACSGRHCLHYIAACASYSLGSWADGRT